MPRWRSLSSIRSGIPNSEARRGLRRAWARLKERRPVVNPNLGFWRQLQGIEADLRRSASGEGAKAAAPGDDSGSMPLTAYLLAELDGAWPDASTEDARQRKKQVVAQVAAGGRCMPLAADSASEFLLVQLGILTARFLIPSTIAHFASPRMPLASPPCLVPHPPTTATARNPMPARLLWLLYFARCHFARYREVAENTGPLGL